MASGDGKPEQLRIVLLGDSGSGKSSTGNTIKRAFTTRRSQDPEILTCQVESGEFEGTPVTVVDTPETTRPNSTEISKCISYCSSGPHAFLVVIQLKRVTNVEQEMKNLQRKFGENALRYTIILFTGGDDLADRVTAEEFLRHNPVPYGVGYHVFNNRSKDPSQVRELLEKINRMVQRNGSYNIKVKDWKQKYLYPFVTAVTIGSGIGAASRGTAEDLLIAVIGSAVGAIAATARDNANVAVAHTVCAAAVGAVLGAIAVALNVAPVVKFSVEFALIVEVVVLFLAVGGILSASIGVVVAVAKDINIPGSGFKAGFCAVAGAGVAFGALAVARPGADAVGLVDALRAGNVTGTETVAMCLVELFGVGLVNGTKLAAKAAGAITTEAGAVNDTTVDALHAGVVIGTEVAGKAAGAIMTGAGSAGAAFKVFGDIGVRSEAIWGIIGGAGVGAGVSAAVGACAAADYVDLIGACFAVVIGVTVVLVAVYMSVIKSDSTVHKIVGVAIVFGVAIEAAIGAAISVLGVKVFSAGVFIIIACKAVTWCLKKKD